jgi:hypothetical protein
MASLTGWQASVSYQLQHYGQLTTDMLAWLPNWLMVIALVITVYFLARYTLHQLAPDVSSSKDVATSNKSTSVKRVPSSYNVSPSQKR